MILKSDICNEGILNIFADASIAADKTGCYGAAVVYKDDLIDIDCKLAKDSTNNNSEIKAIRLAIEMAIKYKNSFNRINVFSDSQISVFGIRDRIQGWNISNGTMYTVSGTPVQSQEIYIQIVYMILQNNLRVSIYHQKGHVSSHNQSLLEAQHVFEASNGIRDHIDLDFIMYISKWNNYVDQTTRAHLSDTSRANTDPIYFIVNEFDKQRYNQLIKRGEF